mmetsp:Transcript_36731/g.83096  ORF Transcript_36731/g.83096 Transcript_36731/m.83096 type:complete len:204 (+) Transcript_36731:458-1069(+)
MVLSAGSMASLGLPLTSLSSSTRVSCSCSLHSRHSIRVTLSSRLRTSTGCTVRTLSSMRCSSLVTAMIFRISPLALAPKSMTEYALMSCVFLLASTSCRALMVLMTFSRLSRHSSMNMQRMKRTFLVPGICCVFLSSATAALTRASRCLSARWSFSKSTPISSCMLTAPAPVLEKWASWATLVSCGMSYGWPCLMFRRWFHHS